MPNQTDILVVDDSHFFTEALEHFFGEQDLRVLTLNETPKVLETIARCKPAVVLLDIMMPEIDGIQLCRMVKEQEGCRETIVAVSSTKFFEADKEKAYQAGAEAFITKDISIEEIGRQVLTLLDEKVSITFWGTRGSIPTPGPQTVKYGGNTPCVEVQLGGDSTIIFDAGSGIRALGEHLLEENSRIKGHIFLTHFHWDHIQGLPFFAPVFSAENQFTIYGCETKEGKIGKLLSDQMESIYFPVPLRRFGASMQFRPLDEGSYEIESFRLKTVYLNHPSKTLGYLITHRDKTIGYLTDNEFISNITEKPHNDRKAPFNEFNQKIIEAIHGADLITVDAQYTKDEYRQKRGWGHSHYENVIDIMMAAEVKKIALFHHDPAHSDADMDTIVAHCHQIIEQRHSPLELVGAQEGMEIEL